MAKKGVPAKGRAKGRAKTARGKRARRLSAGLEIDHLFVGTSDFGASWKFWTEIVGLAGESKWGKPEYAGSLEAGGASLVVAQGEEGPYDELGYDVSNGRPQLYLRTADVDALHAAMVKRGARVLRGPLTTHYGARCFSVEGPDGMVVVFTQKR